MTSITLDSQRILQHQASETGQGNYDPPQPDHSYWKEENHTTDNFLRVEQWLPSVAHLTLTNGIEEVVQLSYDLGVAMLRYCEEVKMMANIRDEQEVGKGKAPSLEDADFWDEEHTRISSEWPASNNRKIWWCSLCDLAEKLDQAISNLPTQSAFVKLSVRSPKDSAFKTQTFFTELEELLGSSDLDSSDPSVLSENVRFIKIASFKALKVSNGWEALKLLLRSDRVYVDILQHELFNKKENFKLNVHVAPFIDDLDPCWEFRGFVSNGKKTGLTAYSPWVYDPLLLENKAKIEKLILSVWNEAEPLVSSKNYSIDFAVSPKLNSCKIVEINNFLPPLAGAGLFNYSNEEDRKLVHEGPYSFRVKVKPITDQDFVTKQKDKQTGGTITVEMKPAPPHVLHFIECWRRGINPSSQVQQPTPGKQPASAASSDNSSVARPSPCTVM